MKRILITTMTLLTLNAHALLNLNIDGEEYLLNDDYQTMDGFCVLSGYSYFTGAGGTLVTNRKIVKLNTDGTIKEKINKPDLNKEYWVLASLSCN